LEIIFVLPSENVSFLQPNHFDFMRPCLLFSLVLFFFVTGIAQPASFLNKMQQDSALDVYLRLDWKALEKQKKEKVYQPSTVCCTTSSNDSLVLHSKVRTRGHMRLDICNFPPLKLKIDKDALSGYNLSSYNELDIVNHCENNESYNQLILKEYLAYKLWELVSPYYLKTQLIRLHYQNADGTEAHETSPAFLVENTEELCNRINAREYMNKVISKGAVDRQPFLRLCLFEFMIGNTDWYIPNRHNIEFLGVPGYKLLVTVPYDFDYSGLVNAPYAIANEGVKVENVSVRFYQGWCHTEAEVRGQLQVFLDQKEKILAMPSRIQGMNEKSIRLCVEYLQGFYDIIENPKKLKIQILDHCDMYGS
jgi:hypothetical protein